jgi:putative DNA primase/helicase
VMSWKVPSLLIKTAADGYMLTAPIDMVKVRPDLWPNRKAATRTLNEGVPTLPRFVSITYQLKGPKMNQRLAFFDLNIIPDPRAWLESKLGPLVNNEVQR